MNLKLTHREEQIMRILWKLKKAFVKEIIEELPDPKPPYNTVSSIVRKLEKEGHIAYESFGKTHRYYPTLAESEFKKTTLKSIIKNYFQGSPQALLSYFIEEEELSQEEIKNLLANFNQD